MDKRRELIAAGLITIVMAAGLGWEVSSESVSAPDLGATDGDLINQRALFCPPLPGDTEGSETLTTWSSTGEDAALSIGDSDEGAVELGQDRIRVDKVDGAGPVNIVGSGAPLLADVAMSFTKPYEAVGAAQCSAKADTEWYFPEGSSEVGFKERLLIYNPFPDEAVVRITFFTYQGTEAKAQFAKIPVPSGEAVQARVNKAITQRKALATTISAVRGRVVAWKMLFSKTEDRPNGVEFSLGQTETSTRLFFPLGRVDEGSDERITILNPNDENAVVTATFMTKDGVFQPNQYVEMTIRPNATKVLALGDLSGKKAPPVGPLSAKIESVNDVGVIAEESVVYGSAGFEGVASEFGMGETATSWWVGPAAVSNVSQDALVVLSLGPKAAHLSVTLLSQDRAPVSPKELQDVEVGAGKRAQIMLPDIEGGPFVVRVDSDQPIVVARIAQAGGDIGLVAGLPVTPTEP
ncbi:MAG: hypothetical protein QOH26_998 [Actinomycetota bacterium]|nr:hypothetical protein [Actinomycetota bacterium]